LKKRFSIIEFFVVIAIGVLLWLIIFPPLRKMQRPQNPNTDKGTQMRIISMAPSLTEILFALGLDEEIVGVTKFSTYPPQAKEKTCIGTFWQPDIEAMMTLSPTLMVNLRIEQQAALKSRMERIGCDVMSLQIKTIDELYRAIPELGQAVGKEAAAEAMVQRLKARQAEIAARHNGRSRPRVLWVIQRYPLRVAGRDTFINELIEVAGGVNAIGLTLPEYPPVNTEAVIGSMPDVIIEPVMDPEQFDSQQSSAAEFYHRFEIVPAVQHGRIHIIDGDVVSRLGPRLDKAAELIADCLWKEELNL